MAFFKITPHSLHEQITNTLKDRARNEANKIVDKAANELREKLYGIISNVQIDLVQIAGESATELRLLIPIEEQPQEPAAK